MRQTLHPTHTIKVTSKVDSLALVVGIVQPLTTLPQIYLIYSSHDASNVSLFTWTSYKVASVILLVYGLRHKLPPVIAAQVLWLVIQTVMMISVFIFK